MSLKSHCEAVKRHYEKAERAASSGDYSKKETELKYARIALDHIKSCGKSEKQIAREGSDVLEMYKYGYKGL
ncbi:hypothetical protein CWB89_06330 [Pseudoalteromonas piscicida]|uniref:Uncharacterized protein n=1 Tax=Pseudoalteromonas piscicida TaxID=43662 RepID=A0AAQ2EXI1_PSEO7|nr:MULTISPECIES: hypothetical protein [Pseudoalteromonas]KJY90366.1 hypothetical protein TW75_06935 [Pseudoalteromonas piscicida]TMN43611.1 hypothetical protein CWB95_05095 [Pseudoalteromonas piscicida]TMN44060.1 hypothetical protein CWB94_01545 [Pseudoalteromonas piscicida]TMN56823.1 hypothetical protein CWB92_01660 [Pseudoalteromonas piscicida]TMN57432.1 hypothetical protein CWB91_03505 [Pseudoalteromonas piscicida]